MSKEFNDNTLTLLRNQLGSIGLLSIEQEDMSEAEAKEYNAAISAVFPRIEKDIKKFLYQQLLFISNESHSWEHVIFGRGTYNGLNLLLDYWRRAHIAHTERIVNENEKFDKSQVVGEL